MDDLLEWLDDIDAKYSGLEAISHEPEVIRLQLVEQKGLNEETQRQAEKLKEIAELSRSLVRGRFVEDSIKLKEKLMSLQVQSASLARQGVGRLNELEHALAVAESFCEAQRLLEAWLEQVGQELGGKGRGQAAEEVGAGAGEPKEAVKAELGWLRRVERGVQERKADLETMNKNGWALVRLCQRNGGGGGGQDQQSGQGKQKGDRDG